MNQLYVFARFMFWAELEDAAALFRRQNLHDMEMFNFTERIEVRSDPARPTGTLVTLSCVFFILFFLFFLLSLLFTFFLLAQKIKK